MKLIMKNNYSLIMAGGIGSRFWPMSIPERPKQFLDVLGIGKSLLQMTFERLLAFSPAENIYILTNEDYKDLVLEQLPLLKENQVLTEPERKNTAPCLAYAAAKIQSLNPESNIIVSPADHLILNEVNFGETINAALLAAQKDKIATIGIQPTRPDTGYGYIEVESKDTFSKNEVLPVVQFREKPNLDIAKTFVASGNFYWNSGIFICKSTVMLDALAEFKPDLHHLFTCEKQKYNTSEEQEFVNNAFRNCEDISIDFAVMEHAKNIEVVLASFDWSDLGTWGSLNDHLKKDDSGNAIIGDNVNVFNSSDSIINIPDGNVAVIDGLEGYIVVQSDNRLMIIKKENEQELKNFVKSTE